MNKKEMLEWLNKFQYTGPLQESIKRFKFSENDLDVLKKNVEKHLVLKGEYGKEM